MRKRQSAGSTSCPTCGCPGSDVKDSRGIPADGRIVTRRRRYCHGCGRSFRTIEITEDEHASLLSWRRYARRMQTTGWNRGGAK